MNPEKLLQEILTQDQPDVEPRIAVTLNELPQVQLIHREKDVRAGITTHDKVVVNGMVIATSECTRQCVRQG